MKSKVIFWGFGCLLVALLMISILGCQGEEVTPSPDKENGAEEPAGTNGEADSAEEEKLTVAVSIVPQKTFVEKIGGDLVDVVLMVPPGYSPATYEPTPQEIEEFSDADLYFSIGVPTEEGNILPHAEDISGLDVVHMQKVVEEEFPVRKMNGEEHEHNGHEDDHDHDDDHAHDDHDHDHGGRDPHIWLSPQRAQLMVETMADEMADHDETNREIYQENASAYVEELQELDEHLEETFAELDIRKFIVFHPAYGYLADDYDLEMHALEYDGKEAPPEKREEIVDLAQEEDIRTIFYQDEIDSQLTEQFAEEIGGKTHELAPLAPDYIDNLKSMADTMAEVME